MSKNYRFETLQLHAGQETPDPATGARAVPIYQTASYCFDDCQTAEDRFALKSPGNIYSRLTNPTQSAFEERMTKLEGGKASLALASGSAAIAYSIQCIANVGDHIVAMKDLYGGTSNLFANTLPNFGIDTTFVDIFDENAIQSAIKDNTKAIFIETLTNPNSLVVDIKAIADIAHKNKIPLIVDNTFGTPYLIRPIEHGADVVIHSATKFIGGHGTSLGGVITDGGNFDWTGSGKFDTLTKPNPSYHGLSFTEACGDIAFVMKIRAIILRDLGACLSPFHAFFFLQGLETLSLRVERHVENALKVVEFLEKHPKVSKVNHPSISTDESQKALYKKYYPNGAGSIFTFEVNGNESDTKKVIDKLELFSLLANVADVKSLVIHPASTTHSQLTKEQLAEQGITPSTVRVSIGTENILDIIEDLEQALA